MAFGLITFTTDYGLRDGYVAACEGVIATLAPRVRVLHVTHLVPPQDVRRGAVVLAQTVPYLPAAVHLAVVDPGVGTDRRAVALHTPRGALVGPDNGLLIAAARALGGITSAHELSTVDVRSATFHGRDVFAPAAARLALGERVGTPLDPAALVRLPEPETVATPGQLRTEVLTVDGFGNVALAAGPEHLDAFGGHPGQTVHLELPGGAATGALGRTFADVPIGELLVHLDSSDRVELAVNRGAAAARLALRAGDEITLRLEDSSAGGR